MTTAVFSCMRNEGPFLLEWLAYHRVIGFDRILIATNACTDGSDDLCAALAQAGVLTHLPHSPAPGQSPQDSGMRAAFAHLADHPVDWLLHSDADEYLWLAEGHDLTTLIATAGNADVIALPWCAFGDNGHATWPGATLPFFTRRGPWPNPEHDKFKSLFRPAAFSHAHDHMPTGPRTATPRVVSTTGAPLDPAPFFSAKHHSRYRPLEISLAPGPARLNHYAIRSSDTFQARARRGDGQGKDGSKYRLGSRWHRIANRNEVEDRSILRLWPATLAELAHLRALPGIALAEAAIPPQAGPSIKEQDA